MKDRPELELLQVVAANVGYDIIDYHKQERVGINEETTVFYVFHKTGVTSREFLN